MRNKTIVVILAIMLIFLVACKQTTKTNDEISGKITLELTYGSLNGTVSQGMNAHIKGEGGIPDYHFKISTGSLPPGVVLQELVRTGRACGPEYPPCPPLEPIDTVWVSGTPSKAGTYTFEITVWDDFGNAGKKTFVSSISEQ